MANTYTQLYIQCIFATKYRAALLQPQWEERLRTYISTIAKTNGHKMIAINNMPDHLHLFVGLNPNQSISEMMRKIKGDSSEWINNEKLTARKFQWQEGYGAFSYSRSQVDAVAKYVMNQQEHHKKTTFLDEYKKMLEKFEVSYDERYIFKLPEEQ
jgi:putative transposase